MVQNNSMYTPILFLVFNRPETTKIVFEQIRKIKPKYLYVAADGPREDKYAEKENCNQVKRIIDGIDWDCNLQTLYREKNLGCKIAVSSAITWFFEHVEEGIILEDDIVPDSSFFYFCSELLIKYKNNNEIMHIGGSNFQKGIKRGDSSYYFSIYPHIWGWASWRRAWNNYDVNVSSFNEFVSKNKISNILTDKNSKKYWLRKFSKVSESQIDTWDYQWVFSIWNKKGICITPNSNLVQNIGIGLQATHTRVLSQLIGDQVVSSITQITHPDEIIPNTTADKYSFQKHFSPPIITKIKIKIYELILFIKAKLSRS